MYHTMPRKIDSAESLLISTLFSGIDRSAEDKDVYNYFAEKCDYLWNRQIMNKSGNKLMENC